MGGWVGMGWDGMRRPRDRLWRLASACVARSCARLCGGGSLLLKTRALSVRESVNCGKMPQFLQSTLNHRWSIF